MKRRAVVAVLPAILAGCTGLTGDGSRDNEFLDASGDIEIRIDGEVFDLSADRFQAEHAENDALEFHLHESDDQ